MTHPHSSAHQSETKEDFRYKRHDINPPHRFCCQATAPPRPTLPFTERSNHAIHPHNAETNILQTVSFADHFRGHDSIIKNAKKNSSLHQASLEHKKTIIDLGWLLSSPQLFGWKAKFIRASRLKQSYPHLKITSFPGKSHDTSATASQLRSLTDIEALCLNTNLGELPSFLAQWNRQNFYTNFIISVSKHNVYSENKPVISYDQPLLIEWFDPKHTAPFHDGKTFNPCVGVLISGERVFKPNNTLNIKAPPYTYPQLRRLVCVAQRKGIDNLNFIFDYRDVFNKPYLPPQTDFLPLRGLEKVYSKLPKWKSYCRKKSSLFKPKRRSVRETSDVMRKASDNKTIQSLLDKAYLIPDTNFFNLPSATSYLEASSHTSALAPSVMLGLLSLSHLIWPLVRGTWTLLEGTLPQLLED